MEHTLEIAELPAYSLKGENPQAACIGKREVKWDSPEGRETKVYDFDLLEPGNRIEGPALVKYKYSVCAVRPDWVYVVDKYRNGVLDTVR
jgi:N-methylhydantoinase A/acetophenone carboxylase